MSRLRVLITGLLTLLCALGVATTAYAEAAYKVTLEGESGRKLPTFLHQGQLFVLGAAGARYNVRVTNQTTERVEAVVTVDGRDVLSGQPGDYVRQRGYVLPARGSVLIEGFRRSESEVAAFRFTAPSNSYSARMGTPENVGVVGVALFTEAPAPVKVARPDLPYGTQPNEGLGASTRRSSDAPAAVQPAAPAAASSGSYESKASAKAADRASNIGTQYGEQLHSDVSSTRFVRASASRPRRVLSVRYDDRKGLEARGIQTRKPAAAPVAVGPSPFPKNRFAPPPPPAQEQPVAQVAQD